MRRLLLMLLLWPMLAFGATPPAGSPAALGQYPRLIVTQANRAAIRTYVHTYYSTEFQALLNQLADPSAVSDVLEGVWGPVNYSFPVALGVTELQALGYTFPAAYDTDAELCDRGYYYATNSIGGYATQVAQLQNSFAADNNYLLKNAQLPARVSHTDFVVPLMLLFDWCHAELTVGEKGVIADAFYEQYDENWDAAALAPNTLLNFGQGQTLSNRFDGHYSPLLFGLTAWGDSDILDGTKRQALYDAFYTFYVDRYIWEIDWSNAKAGFREGMDYYSHTAATEVVYEIVMIDTALGTTYAADRPYFSKRNELLAAWVYPSVIGRTTSCGTGGATRCIAYVEPWGNNTVTSTGLNGLTVHENLSLTIGFARFMGFTADANVGRWVWDNIAVNTAPTYLSTPDTKASGLYAYEPWGQDVFFLFLFGVEGTSAATPSSTAIHAMWDYFLFRSGYDQDSTHLFVGASIHHSSGHESQDNSGTFALHKQGNLIVNASSRRSGNCVVDGIYGDTGGTANIIKNIVGIHSGSSDATLGYDVNTSDATWAARGLGANMLGPIAAEPKQSTSTRYSYVQTDNDLAWTQATVMQREFTYLRGTTDHEYLVILDRANVSDTANDPIWKVWVTRQPVCVDATCSAGRTGQWTGTGKVVSVTNEHAGLTEVGGRVLPPTDAKMFIKSLLPVDSTLNILGDDGTFTKMYQTGNNNGDTFTFQNSSCDTGSYDFFGWGRVEFRPGTVGTTNTFLNVIQFGDADTLTTMSDTAVAQVLGDDNWHVASIQDTERNRLVAFAKVVGHETALAYRFQQTTDTADHLVVNLTPDTAYYVAQHSQGFPFLGLLGFAPALALPWVRRKAIPYIVLLTMIALLLIQAFPLPVTMTVSVSKIPTLGAVEYHADAAGVLFFTTER